MSNEPEKKPFNPFAEGSPASETEKDDVFEETPGKGERIPPAKTPAAPVKAEAKPADPETKETTSEKPTAPTPVPPARAKPKITFGEAAKAPASPFDQAADTIPPEAMKETPPTRPPLSATPPAKPQLRAQAAPVVRPTTGAARPNIGTSASAAPRPRPTQSAAANKPLPPQPVESSDGPSLIGVIVDAVAAAVAIAFTVLAVQQYLG